VSDGDRGDRLAAARRLLREAGLAAEVSEAGAEGDIAAVSGAPSLRARLAELAPGIRALGYRYVALDPMEEHNELEDT
jgi:hypothetical protein